ncbi:MAG: ATP-binding protein [Candidatus Lokiarchaeota archaeon]|nr:ATP-binding protein [Candidatus Lokiarchaeota archaeon]
MTTPLSSPKLPINIIQRFEDFYRLFEDSPGIYKYQEQIKDISAKGGNTLTIFYEDLLAFDFEIAEMLKKDPEPLIEDSIKAFKNLLKFQTSDIHIDREYYVRFSTKDEKSPIAISIRGLRSKHIDKLVCINGITIRSSVVRPKLTKAVFECIVCGSTFEILQLTSSIRWPNFCSEKRCKAKAKSDFRLITKKSEFIDWQSITIQEVPEDLPPGRIPRSIQAILTHDLVDYVKPGDRIKLVGIFKSVLATSMNSNNSNLFKTFIETNYIDPEDKSEEHIDITKEEKIEIENLAKEPFIQRKIARSIAPTIYGRDDLKMACALSLFAGTRKKKSGGGYKRGDIHVLFVGDPGTGKSIHGSEKIYIGEKNCERKRWVQRCIGNFVDELLKKNSSKKILNGDTELLRLENLPEYYTYSINPKNFKTQESKINEISRHKTKILIKIKTKNGREILATPNHSFSTLINGKFQTIDANQLFNMKNFITKSDSNQRVYLPVARNIECDTNFHSLNMADNIDEKDSQNSYNIIKNISLYNQGKITLNYAAKNTNIAKSTILLYSQNSSSIPSSDWIRKKGKINWTPHFIELNDVIGRIVGLYLAEGDFNKNSVRITNTHPDIINSLQKDIKSIFNKVSIYNYDNSIQIHNSLFKKWILKNFGNHAENKKINSQFLFTPEIFRLGLLSGYFSGDGYIEKNNLNIVAITASRELAYAISDMLSTFGIFATIGYKKIKSGQYRGYLYYKIILTGDEAIKFHNKIGFIIKNKQDELKKSIQIASETYRYQKKDTIPNFGPALTNIMKDLSISAQRGSWIRSFYGELRGKTQRQRMGRIYLRKIVQKLEFLYNEKRKEYCNDLIWLRSLSESDILWDEIENIDVIERNCYVYDLGTTDHHFIVANGNLIVHNSEILKSAVEISPRGLYTSGKGSSAVGLTAAVIKDNDTGQMNLEAGAIVLANGGVAAIDEFDKMTTADRSALHEALEQQTVSIAKAGIVATLKAETAVISAANPYSGRYDIYKTPTQNIRLPPSLLSRFDLIFVVVDRPNKEEDAQMAEFILQNAMEMNEDDNLDDYKAKDFSPISGELLKKYIKHAKRACKPRLTKVAKNHIKEFYLRLRGDYSSEDAIVSILARNLDALVRLSEAHAKMALREKVLKEDVVEIIKLFKRYLKDTGYDETTGKIDMDRIFVGESRSKLNKFEKLMDRIKEIFEENNGKMLERKSLIQILDLEEQLEEEYIKKMLKKLINEGTLYEPKQGYIKFTRNEE